MLDLLGKLDIGIIDGVATVLGFGVLGLFGVLRQARKTVEEITDAAQKTRVFTDKYLSIVTSPTVKAEYEVVRQEWIEALDHTARLLEKLKQKKLAAKLRAML